MKKKILFQRTVVAFIFFRKIDDKFQLIFYFELIIHSLITKSKINSNPFDSIQFNGAATNIKAVFRDNDFNDQTVRFWFFKNCLR